MKEIKTVFQPYMFRSMRTALEKVTCFPMTTILEAVDFHVVDPGSAPNPKTKLNLNIHSKE